MMFDDLQRTAEHDAEIKASRVGKLGGSDAALLMQLASTRHLTQTALDRINVLLGLQEPQPFETAATNAGHLFEDWVEMHAPQLDVLKNAGNLRREVVLGKARGWKHFSVQAHADFISECGVVFECKYTKDDTRTTALKYAKQLQWYYWMGAKSVYLVHGRGSVEPFYPLSVNVVKIKRDRMYTRAFRAACNYLNELCDDMLNYN